MADGEPREKDEGERHAEEREGGGAAEDLRAELLDPNDSGFNLRCWKYRTHAQAAA